MGKKGPEKKRKACAYVHTYMPTATAVAAHAGLYDAVLFHADTCGMHCSHQHQQCPLFELLVQNLLILSKIFLHLSYETTYLVRPHCMQGLGSISKKCEYLLEVLNYVNYILLTTSLSMSFTFIVKEAIREKLQQCFYCSITLIQIC